MATVTIDGPNLLGMHALFIFLLLVPVYYVLRLRRAREYRRRIVAVMDSGDLEAFAHLREIASGLGLRRRRCVADRDQGDMATA